MCSNCTAIVVKSLDATGPAVISVSPRSGGFSMVFVSIRNLEIRTYDNPAISGIDMGFAQQCNLLNVFVNTGIYSVQAAKPTHGTSGVITPHVGNGAYTMLRNVVVSGYFNGIICNEHTDGDGIGLDCNVNGLSFSMADHASRFGRVCAQRNTYDVTVTGAHGFAIQQLDVEHAGPGQETPENEWQKTIADINDPKNLGVGDVTYWVVEGAVGPVTTFNKTGGIHVADRRIGAAPKCALKSDDSANSGVFNAADFGAIDDDSTNNTAAFSACIEALIAAGGGQMVLPRSRLGISRGNILIPPMKKWTTVEIVGTGQLTPVSGTVGNSTSSFCSNCSHTVVQSLEAAGPAVIQVAAGGSGYESFSNVFVSIRNLGPVFPLFL